MVRMQRRTFQRPTRHDGGVHSTGTILSQSEFPRYFPLPFILWDTFIRRGTSVSIIILFLVSSLFWAHFEMLKNPSSQLAYYAIDTMTLFEAGNSPQHSRLSTAPYYSIKWQIFYWQKLALLSILYSMGHSRAARTRTFLLTNHSIHSLKTTKKKIMFSEDCLVCITVLRRTISMTLGQYASLRIEVLR